MQRLILYSTAALFIFIVVISVTFWPGQYRLRSTPAVDQAISVKQNNTTSTESQIPIVTLCNLTKNPECYAMVRVRAILVADGKRVWMYLLDKDCGEKPIWMEAWCSDLADEQCLRLKESLNRFLGKNTERKPITANVEVIGEFVPVGEYFYGHRLFIRELIQAEIIKPNIPRPPKIKKRPC